MALAGLKVIEFAGLAPGPFAGLVLADNGAEVIRIDRPGSSSTDILCRGKRSIAVNSKISSGRDLLKKMLASADVVIDPFRPGVMERLGLGPDVFLGDGTNPGLNERLIYARIVGFPRTGPHKDMAGHDINYAALSGVLAMLPGKGKPHFPLNILADFAGGGLMCAMGILLALVERGKSGKGQVVNADMVTGARYVSSFPLIHALISVSPYMNGPRGTNLLDGGAPFYGVYECKDGGWMSVGCLEPQFFEVFLDLFLKSLPKDFLTQHGWNPTLSSQGNRDDWPKFFEFLEKGFLTNTRDYWTKVYHGASKEPATRVLFDIRYTEGTEACTVPVLTPMEASKLSGSMLPESHPIVKNNLVSESGQHQAIRKKIPSVLQPGQHAEEILCQLGLSEAERRRLLAEGALGKPQAKL